MRLSITEWDNVYWKLMNGDHHQPVYSTVGNELLQKLDMGFVERYMGASNLNRLVTIRTSSAEDQCIHSLLGSDHANSS